MYLYTYACHEDEADLCRLELRCLFGQAVDQGYLISPRAVDPSRSPFLKQRLEIVHTCDSYEMLKQVAGVLQLQEDPFKLIYVRTAVLPDYKERLALARDIGSRIAGTVDMRTPQQLWGIANTASGWHLGKVTENEAVWLRHQSKPRSYSTALSTRVARAVANIAVPDPAGVQVIDPCCGIGTVLIEALSMGIDIVGNDINPLAVTGARENLLHFGYPNVVKLTDMRELSGHYEAAILDMPYNLCSVFPPAEQLMMLIHLRSLTDRAVIVTTTPITDLLDEAGFEVKDTAVIKKGAFRRSVFCCE